MKNLQRIAVILVFSLFLIACSGGSSEPEASSAANDGSYPKMGVAELDAFLVENPGKPTIVLFWTTWCPSCKEEIPEMEKLNKSHGDKINILAVSLDEKVEALDAFFAKQKVDLPVYMGDQAIAQKYEVEAIPTLAFFDKTGKLTFAKAGAFPYAMLQAMAEKMIGQ